MSGPTGALLAKERTQHAPTLLWLIVFALVFCAWQWLALNATQSTLSDFTLVSLFCVVALPLIALVLGQVLVADEYYSNTQRFLESLPVDPRRVVVVKFVIGLVVVLLLGEGALLAGLAMAAGEERVTWTMVGIMAARVALYVTSLWSVIHLFSMLGRWRIPVAAIILCVFALVVSLTTLNPWRFGPLALISPETFGLERSHWPLPEMVTAFGMSGLLFVVAVAFARAGEGSLVERLTKPISSLEANVLIVLGIAAFGGVAYFAESADDKIPTHIGITVSADGDVGATAFADELGGTLADLRRLVGDTGAAFEVEVETSPKSDAVATGWGARDRRARSAAHYGVEAVHSLLYAKTHGRALVGENHWVTDGFSAWWALHARSPAAPLTRAIEPMVLQTLHTADTFELTDDALREWDATMHRLGEDAAIAVAYTIWRVLDEHHGRTVLRAWAKAEFGRATYGDIRDWWSDQRGSVAVRYERATGEPLSELLSRWRKTLQDLRTLPSYARAIADLPRGKLAVGTGLGANGTRELRFVLALAQPLPVDARCFALHREVPPFDVLLGSEEMRKDEMPLVDSGSLVLRHEVVGQYSRSARVHAFFDCDIPAFGGRMRFGGDTVIMP